MRFLEPGQELSLENMKHTFVYDSNYNRFFCSYSNSNDIGKVVRRMNSYSMRNFKYILMIVTVILNDVRNQVSEKL